MGEKRLVEQRRKILKYIEKDFTDEMIAVAYTDGETENGTGVLTAFLDDLAIEGTQATGEFFFVPMDEEEAGMQIFMSVFTLIEEVEEENLGEMIKAISILNAYVPMGAFAYDPSGRVVLFKCSQVMPITLSVMEMQARVEMSMDMAMRVVGRFGYLVYEVGEGIRKASSVSALLSPLEMQTS